MTLQTQQTAELLRSIGQVVLVDAHHRGRVVSHDDHPRVEDCPAMAFVVDPRCAPAQQARNDTFDYRTAIATGAGEVHLRGGARALQARFVQHPPDVRWGRGRGERFDRVRDAHSENPPGMERLAQLGVVEGQIARQRVNGRRRVAGGPAQGELHFVDQGHDIAGVTRIPDRQHKGKDEARGGLGDDARFAAKLGGAVALAFANRGDGGIVGIDNFALAQGLALGEVPGLGGDLGMGVQSDGQLGDQAGLLALSQLGSTEHARLRGSCQLHHGTPSRQQLRFRLAHHAHKHLALSATLAAKAAHDLGEVLLELLRLGLQRRARDHAVLGEGRNDLEDFFFALYKVAASLTRWLPCSLGKVSTTRCAGLTSPCSMAAAAWSASSSSINAASIRLRNWANTSGSTKCPWARSAWTSVTPQAYITAKSVRSWLQICSSEQ